MSVIPASIAACSTRRATSSDGRPLIESGIPPKPILLTESIVYGLRQQSCRFQSGGKPPHSKSVLAEMRADRARVADGRRGHDRGHLLAVEELYDRLADHGLVVVL